jgi:putative ABC transport system permease protein
VGLFVEDVPAAIGQLRRQRGAVITLIAVLAVTSAVCAAAFDLTAAYLWRPLPYPAAERLVAVEFPRPGGPGPRELQQIDWAGLGDFAELVIASDVDSFTVTGAGAAFSSDGRWMSADTFAAFGVIPAAGRLFTAAEATGQAAVAVISHRLWHERFQGSVSAIGQAITVRATLRQGEAETVTIVGVLPPRFWLLEDTDLVFPLEESGPPLMLRLRPGVTTTEATARISAIVREQVPTVTDQWSPRVSFAHEAHVARIRPMLTATCWSVLLLALVAVANLAFLQMARGVGRQREFAVRHALGATRSRLVRFVLAEALVIGGVAGALGTLILSASFRAALPAIERYLGRVVPSGAESNLGASPVVMLALVAAALAVSVLLAALLLAAATTPALQAALAGHASSTDTPARLLIRQLIVGTQIGVAFCLLVAAVLMVRTAWHLGRIDLGFNPTNVLSANVTLHESAYRSLALRQSLFKRLLEEIEHLPGVSQVGLTGWIPFRVGPAFAIEPDDKRFSATKASIQGVTPGYFPALEMPLRAGRFISADDGPDRERVAVVSEALAKAVWQAEPAIGQTFRLRFSAVPTGRPGFGPYRVIGVVGDNLRSLIEPTPPQVYLAFAQEPLAMNAFLQIRTVHAPLEMAPAMSRVLSGLDPNVPLAAVNSLEALVGAEGVRPRFLARVLAGFAGLALVVSIVGLYAVSAWIAGQRQREAALRVALGADQRAVALLLARRGLLAVVGGLGAGWLAARPLTLLMAAEFHGVSAGDVGSRLTVATALAIVSTIALWGPAWRASTRDLSGLLRTE